MNGILNILKPPGMTSFDVVGYLRGLLRIKKIGHTGTLDPGAVGVLPICIGSATKAIEYLIEKDKVYRTELTLGVETDTQDSTGKIINSSEVNIPEDRIIEAINSFVGKYSQIPPMYSAIKVNGKKLYELARSGIEVEREPREVEIYWIKIISVSDKKVIFDVACSKGTYIRTLCSDIGKKLGCGGHMSFLIRLKAGNFDISSAITLEEISELLKRNRLSETLLELDKVLDCFCRIVFRDNDIKKLLNGAFIKVIDEKYKIGEVFRIYDEKENFIALGEIISKWGEVFIKIKKVF